MSPTPPSRRLIWVACALVGVPALSTAQGATWIQAIHKEVLDRITITGNRDLSFHWHHVTGDRSAFDTTNYFGQGNLNFTNTGNVRIEGNKVLGMFDFSANILDSRLTDPVDQKMSLNYDRGNWEVNAGDLRPGLINQNRFANFNKTLRGMAVAYKVKKNLRLAAVRSQVKGSARTVSITGTNSSGPYYVGYSSLIPGTEQVMVNGNRLMNGPDYTVDYVIGTITLVGKVLSPTDSMVVSFEAYSIGGGEGTVTGLEATYDMHRGGRIAVTQLRQETPGSGVATSRLEQFQGFGPPTSQYILQFQPVSPASVTIYLNGTLQTFGVDYVFDARNPAIFYFTRYISLDSTISVTYFPKPTSTVDGNRQNFGIDYRLPLQFHKSKEKVGLADYLDKGFISVNNTFGKLEGVTPTSGTARSVTFAMSGPKYDLRMENRNVPQGFAAVESVGFNRNEDANDQFFTYRPSPKWRYDLSRRNSAVLVSNGTDFVSLRSLNQSGTVQFNPGGSSFWTASQSSQITRSIQGTSKTDSTDLLKNDQIGSWGLSYGLTRQVGSAPISSTQTQSFSSDGIKLSATYLGLGPLTFNGTSKFLNIKQGSASGKAKEIELGAQYRFSPKSRLNMRFFDGDGGSISQINGYSNGDGSGYNGNGFLPGNPGTNLGGANTRSLSASWDYQPSERFGFVTDYSLTRYSGGISSNSDTKTLSLAARGDLGKGYQSNLILNRSDTSFLGSPTNSGTTTITGSLEASPKGRFNWALEGSLFTNSGSSTFKQNGSSGYFRAGYFLKDRQRLSLDLSTINSTGTYGQSESSASISYLYQIWQSVALRASFVRRIVNPSSSSSGGYRANSFDLGLSFSFGR